MLLVLALVLVLLFSNRRVSNWSGESVKKITHVSKQTQSFSLLILILPRRMHT